jgi:hypothetical protein
MKTASPDRPPAAGADPEALIKEARRRQHRRYLVAGLAIAVMLAVPAAIIVTVGTTAHQPPAGHQASGLGPIPSGPSAAAYVASGQIPRYYVAITSRGNPNNGLAYAPYAVVRATATGATLATIKPSVARGTIVAVTAAADDRTFVLDETPYAMGGNTEYGPRTFYLLRLSADGRVRSLSRLPMSLPFGPMMTGLALSPDGSKLAMAVAPDPAKDRVEVRVYTLATAAVRTWYGTGNISFGVGADDTGSLSWAADERTLAFDWAGSNPGVWLLNLDAGGSNLLADSRLAVPLAGNSPPTQPTCQPDMIITPDGSAVVCAALAGLNPTMVGTTPERAAETEFFEYSMATGKLARILGHWTSPNAPILIAAVLWSNPSGSVLIGVIPAGGGLRIGVIRGNEFTPLPVAVYSEATLHSGTW